MKYNNIEDMILVKRDYQIEKERFEQAIKDAIQNRKQVKGKSKNYWTEVIKTYKKRVTEIDEDIKNISQTILKLSSFPNNILMPFLIECMNIYEEESFVHSNVMLSYNFNCAEHISPVYVNYNLIFPESIKSQEEKLENTFLLSKMPIAYKELFESNNAKYLMMPNSYETPLIVNGDLNPYFNGFPYLKRIAITLANTRLLEPNMNLQDILANNLEMEKIFAENFKDVDGPKKELKQ